MVQRLLRIVAMFSLTLSLAAFASAQAHEDHKDKHANHQQGQMQQGQMQPGDMPKPNPNQGYFGAKFGEITDEKAEELGLDSQEGVVIIEIIKDSPAEKAGIKEDDVVRKLDDKEIGDVQGFVAIMRQSKPEQQLKVSLIREKKPEEVTVTLGKRPAAMDAPPKPDKGPTTKPD